MVQFHVPFVLLACATGLGSAFNVVGVGASKFEQVIGFSTGHELAVDEAVHPRTANSLLEEKVDKRPKKNPLGDLILGLLLWWIVPVFIWNNERIAIKQYKMQLKAERWSVHIDDPEVKPIDNMNGRIVYLTGNSSCIENISDEAFPKVTRDGVIKLRRSVQMFQWKETEHKNTDKNGRVISRWYTYDQKWMDEHSEVTHDESKRNPPFPLPSTKRAAGYRAGIVSKMKKTDNDGLCFSSNGGPCAEAKHENVKLGAYYLGEYVIREMENWHAVEGITGEQVVVNPLMVTDSKEKFEGGAALKNGYWYFGNRTGSDLGNVRVFFEELKCGPVTICGVLAKTEQGFTFVPILRPDSGAEGEGIWAELGGGAAGCCVSVQELHYEHEDDADFKERLKNWPMELTLNEKNGFKRATTTKDVAEYNPEAELEDLCCVGPCGGQVIKFMHYLGLEEEFLGVTEKRQDLETMMEKEGADAASRHCTARFGGCFCLCIGSLLIISPITTMLTGNWLVAALGGALLSAFISGIAMLCSFGCFVGIMSCAWLAHRPTLAVPGFMVCFFCFFCMYWGMVDAHEHSQQNSGDPYGPTAQPPNQGYFLAIRHLSQMAH